MEHTDRSTVYNTVERLAVEVTTFAVLRYTYSTYIPNFLHELNISYR